MKGVVIRYLLWCLCLFYSVTSMAEKNEVWIDEQGHYYYAVPEKHIVLADELTPSIKVFNEYPYVKIIPWNDGYRTERLTQAEFDALKHLLQVYGKRFKGDFSGNGKPDVLIQTKDGRDILVSGGKTSNYRYSAKTFNVGVMLNSDTVFEDRNSDGRLDIVDNSTGTVMYAQSSGFSPPYKQGDYVGSLAGSYNVTPSGEFSYALPITTAPATGNFSPDIGLQYHSGGANGHLGMGWTISGIRSISRCEQNLELNGTISSVNFSASDRFCLDGQQLIVRNGQTYGANNAEYRTAQDNFEKVISKTSSGVTGPVSFEARDTKGNTYFFGRVGNDSDALILASNNAAFIWALKKVQDSSGNYYTFHYTKDAGSLEFYLTQVKYSGNSSIVPSNSITFEYGNERTDRPVSYVAGQKIQTTKRLNKITSRLGSQVLRSYNLSYNYSFSPLSNLSSITACDANNKCLSPTTFGWDNTGTVTGKYGGKFSNTSRYLSHQMWDFNGDGLLDIAYVRNDRGSSSDHLILIKNTGSSLDHVHTFHDIANKTYRRTWMVVDLDKDGKDEIIYQGQGGYWHQIKYNGSAFTVSRLDLSAPASSDTYSHFVDMDGDGLPELLHTVNNKLSVQKGTKAGVEKVAVPVTVNLNAPGPNRTVSLVPFNQEDNTLKVMDFNGDGKADFIVQVRETYTDPNPDPCRYGGCCDPNYPHLCTEVMAIRQQSLVTESAALADVVSATVPIGVANPQLQYPVEHTVEPFPDDNVSIQNDGMATAMNSSYSTVMWKVLISNSATSLSEYATIGSVGTIDRVMAVDLNADGLADIVYRQASDKKWFARFNNGTGFNAALPIGIIHDDNLKFHGVDNLRIVYEGNRSFCFYRFDGEKFVQDGCRYDDVGRQYWSTNFIDMNGDGEPDILDFNGRYHVEYLPRSAGRRIVSVTDGFNEKTVISYANLTDPSVHIRKNDGPSKNWGNGALVRDIKGAIPVVRTLKSSADLLTYQYTGGKMQIGRGLLGFEQVQITSSNSGIRTTTTYRQDGDFRGSVIENKTEITTGENTPPPDPCSINPRLCEPDPCYDFRFCDQPRMIQRMDAVSAQSNSYGLIWSLQSRTTISYDLKSNTAFATNGNKTQARFVYPKTTTSQTFNTDSSNTELLSSHTQTITSIDAFAQPLSQSETLTDAFVSATTTTANTYSYNDAGNYGGRLTKSTVNKQRTYKYAGAHYTQPAISLSNSFSYDSAGRLSSQISDSGITTRYTLNGFGLITQEQVSAAGMASRMLDRSYDASGRYLLSETNSLGHATHYGYNSSGLKDYVQSANGQRVYYNYNSMGRLISEITTPANNTSRTSSAILTASKVQYWCQTTCPTTATYYEVETITGKPAIQVFYDKTGREVRRASQGFNNVWIYTDTAYDLKGRKTSQTIPYYANTTSPARTWFSYDIQGRVNKLTKPDGSIWLTNYQGLATTSTAPNNKRQTEVKNSLGELAEVTDADNKKIWYLYDSNGNSTVITDPLNNKVVVNYDKWGNKIRIADPDAGITLYSYNTYHELIRQSDANGNEITYQYDVLGRQIRQTRKKGGQIEHDAQTVYDSGAYAIGQLSSVEDLKTGYRQNYYYDTFGRVRQQTSRFDDGTLYNQHWVYDNLGRLQTETDATGGSIQYNYTANHWLNSIDDKELKDASGTVRRYWQATAVDALGNITQDKLGDAINRSMQFNQQTGLLSSISSTVSGQGNLQHWQYQWDVLGNLSLRQDNTSGNLESFSYDSLNRVTNSSTSSSKGNTVTDIRYDALGNITSKTGVGNYNYNSSRPHAVTDVTGTRANRYQYDANGNMVQDNKRKLVYNSFNKPVLISQSNYQVEFSYDSSGNRYKRIEFGGQKGKLIPILMGDITTFIPQITETRYVGSVELVRYGGGSEWVQKRYIADKAIVSKVSSQPVNQSVIRYLLSDHLGSTHVITNASGVKEAVMSFDVFGARRNSESWARQHEEASNGLLSSSITLRGFTGHEQIDDVGLVHMGGRVYDPILGRFLQADPFIQQPNNLQNLNRYSYVLNNPLNATDPSGYFFQMLVVWAVQYIATAYAATAIGAALTFALTAYQYYGYAQMAVGALRAIEGGGTAMANFAGGMAKGYAKGMLFNAVMGGLTDLVSSSRKQGGEVEAKQGSAETDGHKAPWTDQAGNSTSEPTSFNGTETACSGCALQLKDGGLSVDFFDGVKSERSSTYEEVEWKEFRVRLGVPLAEGVTLDGDLPVLDGRMPKLPVSPGVSVQWHHFSLIKETVTLFEVTEVNQTWTRNYIGDINGKIERWSVPMKEHVSTTRIKLDTNTTYRGQLGGRIIK